MLKIQFLVIVKRQLSLDEPISSVNILHLSCYHQDVFAALIFAMTGLLIGSKPLGNISI